MRDHTKLRAFELADDIAVLVRIHLCSIVASWLKYFNLQSSVLKGGDVRSYELCQSVYHYL